MKGPDAEILSLIYHSQADFNMVDQEVGEESMKKSAMEADVSHHRSRALSFGRNLERSAALSTGHTQHYI